MTDRQIGFIYNSLILVFLAIFIFISSSIVFGQETLSGDWNAKPNPKDTYKLQISFYTEKNSDNAGKQKNQISGSGFELTELQGLSAAQISGANVPVNFFIQREAGTVRLSGTFNQGKGAGKFTFSADRNFVAAMNNAGFDNISAKDLFAAHVLDVKSATVADLRASGLQNLEFEDVFKATIFKIDSNYISQMNGAGFGNLGMEDLVKGRIFKIDAEYAREISQMGFGGQNLEELVKFRIFKVTPEFLNQMRGEGLADLNAEQVVKLRIFKIDSEFIQKARAKGYANPSVEELVELKIFGKIK